VLVVALVSALALVLVLGLALLLVLVMVLVLVVAVRGNLITQALGLHPLVVALHPPNQTSTAALNSHHRRSRVTAIVKAPRGFLEPLPYLYLYSLYLYLYRLNRRYSESRIPLSG
jgi:Na+-transporting methylmalonyl-CoA/oxaloacetate decarboxylase gamma subunit